MAQNEPNQQAEDVGEADFAKALQELAKGEKTATALENSLSAMEAKIEALLQQAEKEKQEIEGSAASNTGHSPAPEKN